MTFRIIFLGTSGSIPTVTRGLPAIAVRKGRELLLFDCGEGTQRQMASAGVGFRPKMCIFVSHMHLDHISGLFGLIHTLSLLKRRDPLRIFGPDGLSKFIRFITGTKPNSTFPVEVSEIAEGLVHRGRDYGVYAVPVDHMVPCFAYALVEDERPGRFHPSKAVELGVPKGPLWAQLKRGNPVVLSSGKVVNPEEVCGPRRPGRKIVYSGDTRPTQAVVRLAKGADILVHDATFDDELQERAWEDGHSTSGQAAWVAKEAGVKRLFLTHISARYKDPAILLDQARRIFPRVEVAEDFVKVEVPLQK